MEQDRIYVKLGLMMEKEDTTKVALGWGRCMFVRVQVSIENMLLCCGMLLPGCWWNTYTRELNRSIHYVHRTGDHYKKLSHEGVSA